MKKPLCDQVVQLIEQLWPENLSSGKDSGLSAQGSFAALDAQIVAARRVQDSIAAALVRLRGARNRVAPVNKLPPELLQKIFRYASNSGRDQKMSFLITWTCATWRRVAIADAALWTLIVLRDREQRKHGRELADDLLNRARNFSLTVSCEDWHDLNILKEVLLRERGTSNVANIDISFYNEDDFDIYGDDLKDYNNTKSLSLHLKRDYKENEDDPSDIIIFTDQISHDLPHLEELHLSKCRFFWNATIYTGLTHLSIKFPGIYPDWEEEGDFLEVCRHSPNLHTLNLSITGRGHWYSKLVVGPYKDWAEAHSTPVSSFHMPCLVDITLDLPPEYLLYFLRTVTFPIEDIIQLDLQPTALYEQSSSLMTMGTFFKDSAVSQLIQGVPAITLEVVQAHRLQYMTIEGEGRHSSGSPYMLRICAEPNVVVAGTSANVDFGPSEIVQSMLPVREYVVSAWRTNIRQPGEIDSLIRHATACLPIITKLTIKVDGSVWDPALWDALMEKIDEAANSVPPSSWKLNTVHICSGRFGQEQFIKDRKASLDVEDGSGLTQFCRHLSTLGCDVKELIIDCQILVAATEEDMMSFAEDIFEINTSCLSWADTVFVADDSRSYGDPVELRPIPSQYWRGCDL